MKLLLVGFIALFACPASGRDFDDRVSRANAALASKQGGVYAEWVDEQIRPLITKTLQECFGAVDRPDNSGFLLVADVKRSGELSDVEVRPSTNISRCFAHSLESKVLQGPILAKEQRAFPLVLDLGVHVQ